MSSYIAFLRGINVGGNAIIKMTDLAKVFTSLKFKNVRTFIASGNVLFETAESDSKAIIQKIEKALLKAFNIEIKVMLRTKSEMEAIVKRNVFGKKTEDSNWKLYVVFLNEEPSAAGKKALMTFRNVLEFFDFQGREVYAAVHKSHPKPTFSGNFIEKHFKIPGTARNWNTVNKITKLFAG